MTLEVVLLDALSLPFGQLAAASLCDMVALAEHPSPPKTLSRALAAFTKRMDSEIADLPDGEAVTDWATGLAALDGAKVPETVRSWVRREADRADRGPVDKKRLAGVLATWGDVSPEAFVIGAGKGPKVTKTAEVAPPPTRLPGRAERPERDREERAPRAPASPKAPRVVAVKDPARQKWLESQILERLRSYRETGLAEAILVAGVRHGAKDLYSDLGPQDVMEALRALRDIGKVKHSAGRWSAVARW